ncbi:MAG TPA: 3-dehydroquinate synthase [Bacteroidia bacterium]|nr:3-dehydroquinate synthase [Bacteroidia bacterium]
MIQVLDAGRHEVVITSSVGEALTDVFQSLDISGTKVFVLTDTNTHQHCLPILTNDLPKGFHQLVIGSGELNKNLHTCKILWEQLLKAGADRQSIIINLGGGMVSDIGGFVASTYMRGIPFVNVSTSLLGMVDASTGGKTGIDIDFYKNMVGVFAFPEKVIVSPVFLNTLPDHEWRCGVAEMIKHGLIADEFLWNNLVSVLSDEGHHQLSDKFKNEIIDNLYSSIKVKADIVKSDPFEKNERKFLNFGHTIGHAIESVSLKNDDHPLSHGEAVAIGMICESYISSHVSGLEKSELITIAKTISGFYINQHIKKNQFTEIYRVMRSDKKSHKDAIAMALLKAIGDPVIYNDVPQELILDSFHFYNGLLQ